MVSVPTGLLTVPFLENVNKLQIPFRLPVATTVFSFWLVQQLPFGWALVHKDYGPNKNENKLLMNFECKWQTISSHANTTTSVAGQNDEILKQFPAQDTRMPISQNTWDGKTYKKTRTEESQGHISLISIMEISLQPEPGFHNTTDESTKTKRSNGSNILRERRRNRRN